MIIQPLIEATTKPERRHGQRRKYRGEIEIDWGSAVLKANVRDIGPQGLFIELVPPLWVGARFDARLMVVPVLFLQCTVARVEPANGIGVMFEIPLDSDKSKLESLLLSLPAV